MSFVQKVVSIRHVRYPTHHLNNFILNISSSELQEAKEAAERMRDLEQRVARAKRALATFNYTPPKPDPWWMRLKQKFS